MRNDDGFFRVNLDGVVIPIEAALVSTRHCRDIEIETVDDGWQRLTGWVTYRGEADLKLANDKRLRGVMRQDKINARSATLLWHGDHWCTARGEWA